MTPTLLRSLFEKLSWQELNQELSYNYRRVHSHWMANLCDHNTNNNTIGIEIEIYKSTYH